MWEILPSNADWDCFMFGRFAHCRTNTTLGLICNITPLPCCCDSHTPMLRVCLFCYQALRLPPVSVFTTLVPQSRSSEQHTWCSHSVYLASRVACVRAWSWLSHPRPPDRSQHGCTVGVLPGPTRVLPMPRQYGIGRRAPTRAVLVGVLWCAYTVCGLCRQYVYWIISHTPPRHGHDCGPVDLERHFAPLVAQHSLTRMFFWFHLTASAVLLIGLVSEASDLCLNSLLALTAGLLFSCADGCDCNRRAASSTSCNHSVHTFH